MAKAQPVPPGFVEALSLKHGKGRVAIFGDATFFTSKIKIKTNEKEGMNRAGTDNVQLAINTFRWLAAEWK